MSEPPDTSRSETLARSFPNSLPGLERVIEELLAFLEQHGITGRTAYDVNLAVEEMATNVIKYGYDDEGEHSIELAVELHPETVAVVLEDDGHEFDPLAAPPPDLELPVEDRQPGGLGIELIRQFAREMRYERLAGRNRLTIVFEREPTPP